MAQFGNRVLTTTQDVLLPKTINTILKENELCSMLLKKAKPFRGEQLKKSIVVSKSTSGGSFSGFDPFDTSAQDTRIRLAFDPKKVYHNVTLPLDELTANEGEEAIIDLMDQSLEEAANVLADDIGTMFYGPGTGNSSKDIQGLEAIVDDGTNVATYGGQTRSSYDPLDATVTASGGTLTLAKMSTLWNDISVNATEPDLIMVSPDVWSFYEELLQAKEVINSDVAKNRYTSGAVKSGLDYKGVPVKRDNKATAGVMYMLSTGFLQWYGKKFAMSEAINFNTQIEGLPVSTVKGLGFSWTGWKKPTNQAAVVGQILLYGNLISFAPNKHGKLTGITGV